MIIVVSKDIEGFFCYKVIFFEGVIYIDVFKLVGEGSVFDLYVYFDVVLVSCKVLIVLLYVCQCKYLFDLIDVVVEYDGSQECQGCYKLCIVLILYGDLSDE